MELKEFEEIKNRRYSPKETLAYLIISVKKAKTKSMQNFVTILKEEIIKDINKSYYMDKIRRELLEKIINYWSLSIEQVIAYGYIVFNNIAFEEKPLTEDKIADVFAYTMRLYSPDNAEEFVKNKFLK